MLSYELCKRLKDAGFPIKRKIDESHPEKDMMNWIDVPPSIEDLIRELGEELLQLTRICQSQFYVVGRTPLKPIMGDTPEEALANLYLALHP